MYDEIQDKNITEYKQNANRNTPIDKGYILNRGKGYHYDY